MKMRLLVALSLILAACSNQGFKSISELKLGSLAASGCYLAAAQITLPLGSSLNYWTIPSGTPAECANALRSTTCVAPGQTQPPVTSDLPIFANCSVAGGGGGGTDPTTGLPIIVSFRGSALSINAGDRYTLTWQTTGATSARITGIGQVALSGSLILSPRTTTIYNLMAINAVGAESAIATVTVIDPIPTGP